MPKTKDKATEEKPHRLLTVRFLAHLLSLQPETIVRKARAGEIPAVRVGNRYRFRQEEISAWLDEQATGKRS